MNNSLDILNTIISEYSSNQYGYSNIRRINQIFNFLNKFNTVYGKNITLSKVQRMAIFLHYLNYNPKENNNQEKSVAKIRELFGSSEDITKICAIVMDSKNKIPTSEESVLVQDLHMSIFAESYKEYSAYNKSVEKALSAINKNLYFVDRKQVLESLYEKVLVGKFFHNYHFNEHYFEFIKYNILTELNYVNANLGNPLYFEE